jgi:hypothetical protein
MAEKERNVVDGVIPAGTATLPGSEKGSKFSIRRVNNSDFEAERRRDEI